MNLENLLKKILKGEKVKPFTALKHQRRLLSLCENNEEYDKVLILIDLANETL